MREVIYKYVSFADLASVGITIDVTEGDEPKAEGIRKHGRSADLKTTLPKVLYILGIVDDHNLQIMPKQNHRDVHGKVVEDYRFIGKERTDKKWLNSGFASDEAKMSQSKMKDMVSYASRLSNGGDR